MRPKEAKESTFAAAEVERAPVVVVVVELVAVAVQEALVVGRVPLAPVDDERRARQLGHRADVVVVHVRQDDQLDAQRIEAEPDELDR